MIPVELVLFAIRAGLKLGQEIRGVYIESTQMRALTLPLPAVSLRPDFNSALNYFVGDGRGHLVDGSETKRLFDAATAAGNNVPQALQTQLMGLAAELMSLEFARLGGDPVKLNDGSVLAAADWVSLLTVRQWERGEVARIEHSWFRRIAGTIVEVGIDYFAQMPGALNTSSKQGKILAALVEALDAIPFADIDITSEQGLRDLAGRLFLSAMQTLAERPDFLSSDVKVQELVKVAAKGLTLDVGKRLTELANANAGEGAQLDLLDWGELVFTSVLSSAGGLVLANPQRYLGVAGIAQGAVVTKVGNALLGLAIDVDNKSLRLQNVVGREGLTTIAKAAFGAIAEHPEIFGKDTNQGLRNILVSLAKTLSDSDRLSLEMLPELTRVLLSSTVTNLELIWPGGASDPKKHLLLVAAQRALQVFSAEPPAGVPWKFQFSKAQLVDIVQTVLDELASNPAWLVLGAAKIDSNLQAALEATLAVIRNRGDQRLGTTLVSNMIKASVKAVVLRQEFLSKNLGVGAQPLIAELLDQVLTAVLAVNPGSSAGWQLFRDQSILTIVTIAFDAFSQKKLTPKSLPALKAYLVDQIAALTGGAGMEWATFRQGLEAALVKAAA